MTEQQEHLKNLLVQQRGLVEEINSLQEQIEGKRQTYFKVQGAIEYLTQSGTELPGSEEQPAEEATEE